MSNINPRDFSKVSNTALGHIRQRTYYGIPYAQELLNLIEENNSQDTSEPISIYLTPVFEARYKGGEAVLEDEIKKNPDAQVLELAAGFSLHGATLAEKYPNVHYIETDYSVDFIESKEFLIHQKLLLNKIGNLEFKTANSLVLDELKNTIASFDRTRPLFIYNEGLMAYLSGTEKDVLAENIKTLLSEFSTGAWITPDSAMSAERRNRLKEIAPQIQQFTKNAEKRAGQKYDEHGFRSESDADIYFAHHGFTAKKIPQPINLNSLHRKELSADMKEQLESDIQKHGWVWVLNK